MKQCNLEFNFSSTYFQREVQAINRADEEIRQLGEKIRVAREVQFRVTIKSSQLYSITLVKGRKIEADLTHFFPPDQLVIDLERHNQRLKAEYQATVDKLGDELKCIAVATDTDTKSREEWIRKTH